MYGDFHVKDKTAVRTSVGPLALTNDKIYGPSNVNVPLLDRYDFQTL